MENVRVVERRSRAAFLEYCKQLLYRIVHTPELEDPMIWSNSEAEIGLDELVPAVSKGKS